jgi:hypothetical protein
LKLSSKNDIIITSKRGNTSIKLNKESEKKAMTKAERIYRESFMEAMIHIKEWGYEEKSSFNRLSYGDDESICVRTINAIKKVIATERKTLEISYELGTITPEKKNLISHAIDMVELTANKEMRRLKEEVIEIAEETEPEQEAEIIETETEEAEEIETAQEAETEESEQEKVFEFTTWQYGKEWEEAEQKAITAAKNHKGEKFTVVIGEWGGRTFLVLADSKEEAKALAIEYYNATNKKEEPADKVKVRNVTNCKKYN